MSNKSSNLFSKLQHYTGWGEEMWGYLCINLSKKISECKGGIIYERRSRGRWYTNLKIIE